MANIKSLSTDIIIEYIIPEFDFKTISDVHMSHMFENIDITDMIKTYISHNMIFNDQKYNIYDVLQNSSITVVAMPGGLCGQLGGRRHRPYQCRSM